MKKLILTLTLFALLPVLIMANPPRKVLVTYNEANKTVKVVAVHPVKDVTNHYIKLVVITVDGKEVKVINLDKQATPAEAIVEVAIPEVKMGSVVQAKATCNKFGSKTGTLTVQ